MIEKKRMEVVTDVSLGKPFGTRLERGKMAIWTL